MKQYFVAIKLLNHEAMERFEVSCSKVVVKLFQMSECHFIEKKRGNFEQQVYLYGSSTEFRELFSGIIANHVVRFNVFRGLQEYFKSVLRTLLCPKEDLWKQVDLTPAQRGHEVQMFAGWALHGLQNVDKDNRLKHYAIRKMYVIS